MSRQAPTTIDDTKALVLFRLFENCPLSSVVRAYEQADHKRDPTLVALVEPDLTDVGRLFRLRQDESGPDMAAAFAARIVADDAETRRLLKEATVAPKHRHHAEGDVDDASIVSINQPQHGNTRAYTLTRLLRELQPLVVVRRPTDVREQALQQRRAERLLRVHVDGNAPDRIIRVDLPVDVL